MADPVRKPGNLGLRPEVLLLAAAIVLFAVALLSFFYVQSTTGRDADQLALNKQLQSDLGEIAKVGGDAARGVNPDFNTLEALAEEFDIGLAALQQGDAERGITALPAGLRDELEVLVGAWQSMKSDVDKVVTGQEAFRTVAASVEQISLTLPELRSRYEQIAQRLVERNGSTAAIVIASGQLVRIERLLADAAGVLSRGREAAATAGRLEQEARLFVRSNQALSTASSDAEVQRLAGEVNELFGGITPAVTQVFDNAAAVEALQESAAILQGQSTNVLAEARALEQAQLDSISRSPVLPFVIYGAGVLALILLVSFLVVTLRNLGARQKRAEERDQRQQAAILGLLDEITNLADGDLTVDVTVTEDFTGAIADSINYTVDTLRRLVGTINSTSVEIAAAASSTQDTAQRMNQASERQAREIAQITGTMTQTSASLAEVASQAERLAANAANSVQVAHSGAQTVGRTIQGMASLREQIQDTAKRIKRLGESSQEIGNIIEFINDIAEQTNTLALNASIQAAMAGEAGRGFAVVASEVQRLSERAASATRQIENLVKTIQADTAEAIISMERSTANVVSGAKSAEEAGQSLAQIESSSQDLARLIQDISGSARSQSAQVTQVAQKMQAVRDISVQTSDSAGKTAEAVGELTTLSEKLRESVAGFKLPADVSLNTGLDWNNQAVANG